jgi:phosphoribosylformimino-5-aminoimidazole carboxamide ribotide isomerase
VDILGVEHLIVGVDARDGRVATRGWKTLTHIEVLTFCQQLARAGVRRVLYTDIGRDGMLDGPDVDLTRSIASIVSVIGSGGVSSVEDLQRLAGAGAEGAIIGTALYEGRLTLRDAVAAC